MSRRRCRSQPRTAATWCRVRRATRCWRHHTRYRSTMCRWQPGRRPNRPQSLGCRRFLALAVLLPFADTRGFSATRTEIIELRAADLATAHDLDGIDHWRIEREHAFDALAI